MVLELKTLRRLLLAALCGVFLVVYVFAKVDFFSHYFEAGPAEYLRRHSIYWLAMAGIAFLLWFVEGLFSRNRK